MTASISQGDSLPMLWPGWKHELDRLGYVHLPGIFDRPTMDPEP